MSAKLHCHNGITLKYLREFVEWTSHYEQDCPIEVGTLKTTASFEYSQPFTIAVRS